MVWHLIKRNFFVWLDFPFFERDFRAEFIANPACGEKLWINRDNYTLKMWLLKLMAPALLSTARPTGPMNKEALSLSYSCYQFLRALFWHLFPMLVDVVNQTTNSQSFIQLRTIFFRCRPFWSFWASLIAPSFLLWQCILASFWKQRQVFAIFVRRTNQSRTIITTEMWFQKAHASDWWRSVCPTLNRKRQTKRRNKQIFFTEKQEKSFQQLCRRGHISRKFQWNSKNAM